MTYKELAEQITRLSPEQQNADVSVLLEYAEEIVPSYNLKIMDENDPCVDILDPGHPVIVAEF
jgi:hypothetical protein